MKRPDLPFFRGRSGDADKWIASAQKAKPPLHTGTVARVGAVAVFPPYEQGAGKYGHVAYVEEVIDADYAIVSEANFDGRAPGTTRRVYTGRLHFIYAPHTVPTDPPPYDCPATRDTNQKQVNGGDHTDAIEFRTPGTRLTGGDLYLTSNDFHAFADIGVYRGPDPHNSGDRVGEPVHVALDDQDAATFVFDPPLEVEPNSPLYLIATVNRDSQEYMQFNGPGVTGVGCIIGSIQGTD